MIFKNLEVGKFFIPKSVEGVIFMKLEKDKLSDGLRFNSIVVQGDSGYSAGTMLNFPGKEKILLTSRPYFYDSAGECLE